MLVIMKTLEDGRQVNRFVEAFKLIYKKSSLIESLEKKSRIVRFNIKRS